MALHSVPYDSLSLNPFTKLGQDWALVTAGDASGFNTMTVSWGALGYIWNRPTVTVYIRPQRYTKEFVDANELFTLSFYDESYRKALNICGSKSGRTGSDHCNFLSGSYFRWICLGITHLISIFNDGIFIAL